jgi:hypothetical protein
MTQKQREQYGDALGKLLLVAAALLFAIVVIALAVGLARAAEPTQAQVDACRPDALRLCPMQAASSLVTGNRSAVVACMMAHRAQLSPQCREAFR